jgi:hypothetical protein
LLRRPPIRTWRSGFAPTALGLSLAVRPDGKTLLIARGASRHRSHDRAADFALSAAALLAPK